MHRSIIAQRIWCSEKAHSYKKEGGHEGEDYCSLWKRTFNFVVVLAGRKTIHSGLYMLQDLFFSLGGGG